MIDEMKLGYLVFEARSPDRWREFCGTMLGLPAPVTNIDGSEGYRLDAATQRLIVTPGNDDDLAAIGLELRSRESLAALVARVTAAGVGVEAADERLSRARHVSQLFHFQDPAGNRVEAYVGLDGADAPFASEHFPGGFDTELGIGHVALVHHDLPAMERFYVDVLGHGLSERLSSRVGPLDLNGVFLHGTRRHHNIAVLDLPLGNRIHHFMLAVEQLSAVGRAYERATDLGIPLSLGLGEHSDGTFSFYGATPSGFDFEIGTGGDLIDPETWQMDNSARDRIWGHQPTMRLKLKTLAAVVRQHLSSKRRRSVVPAA